MKLTVRLVRLSIPLWFDWGRPWRPPLPWGCRSFNPTLVRLGPSTSRKWPRRQRSFQSHFGSIGAAAGQAGDDGSRPLSIPLWFDWGVGLRDFRDWFGSPPFNPTLVRLGPLSTPPAAVPNAELSIPLWFDWGPERERERRHRRPPFNPTLVRLGPALHHRSALVQSPFQSHFGSIGAVIGPDGLRLAAAFQSHFGSIGAKSMSCAPR